jgi:hypothetical protein
MQEMLGHTNLSQTSTYLHASEFGLQESIRRFDALRGNPWQRLPRHPPLRHGDADEPDKDTLH